MKRSGKGAARLARLRAELTRSLPDWQSWKCSQSADPTLEVEEEPRGTWGGDVTDGLRFNSRGQCHAVSEVLSEGGLPDSGLQSNGMSEVRTAWRHSLKGAPLQERNLKIPQEIQLQISRRGSFLPLN